MNEEINSDYEICLKTIFSQVKIADWKGVLKNANKLISMDPKSQEGHYFRASAKTFLDDIEGAMNGYNKLIQLYPKFANAYYFRGSLKNEGFGENKSAISDFTKAIDLNTDFMAGTYYHRGLAKAELGDYDGALADYLIAEKMGDKNASVEITELKENKLSKEELRSQYRFMSLMALASVTVMERENHKETIRYLTLITELNPEDFWAFNKRANERILEGDYKRGFIDFQKSIEINPNNAEVYYDMGRASIIQKKLDDAMMYYKKALEIKPDFLEAKNALEKIENEGK
jgi:tetratricopeptide (TPR) repeat protein